MRFISNVEYSATSIVTSARVKELEEKVYNLQEELTANFRKKSETAQSMLDLNNELKNARVELHEKKQL